MHYRMTPARHAEIFGARDPVYDAPGVGRSRLCKSCGGWHKLNAWPHNCRRPSPPRANLATPMVSHDIEPFKTGALPEDPVIGSRRERREYMERNDLVDYDPGIGRRAKWVEEHDEKRERIGVIKRFMDTDPLALDPEYKIQGVVGRDKEVLNDGAEVDLTDVPIMNQMGR